MASVLAAAWRRAASAPAPSPARLRAAAPLRRRLHSSAFVPIDFVRDADPRDPALRLVDCAHIQLWARAHIPGATVLPVDEALKDAQAPNAPVRPDAFEAIAEALGVGRGSHVVFYDAASGMAAARAWWLFRYYGFQRASVLDGGWAAWVRSGSPVSADVDDRLPPAVDPADAVVAAPQPRLLATLDEVAAAARSGATARGGALQVVDARSPGEYAGDDLRGNRFGGRVPGAVSVPFTSVYAPDGSGALAPAEALRDQFLAAGLQPGVRTVTYCQMGMRAAVVAAALEAAGFADVAVYDGSMREYNNTPGLPRDVGAA